MNETGAVPGIDDTDTEIELNAQDLLALADPKQVDEHATSAAPALSKPVKRAPTRKFSLSLALPLAVVVVAAAYGFKGWMKASDYAANPSQQVAQSNEPAAQALAASEPVRFVNPFDADEVFEFPAGTTQAEARDAVADVLLKRAMSRQKT